MRLDRILIFQLFIGVLWAGVGAAQTTVPAGSVGAGATWTAAGSPYLVEGDVVVPSGGTLEIEPGVEVRFMGGDTLGGGRDTTRAEIEVHGDLVIRGTASSPVVMHADATESDWYGIVVASDATRAAIEWAEIEDVRRGVSALAPSDVTSLTSVALQNCAEACVHIEAGNPQIDGLWASRTDTGIFVTRNGGLTLANAVIWGARSYGVRLYLGTGSPTSLVIHSSTIHDSQYGVYVQEDHLNRSYHGVEVRNCIFTSNASTAVYNRADPTFVSVHRSMFWDNGADTLFTGGVDNVTANPQYVDSASGDFRLRPTSVAIDAGSDVDAPSRDVVGVSRPLDGDGVGGAAYDMGAYEYVRVVCGDGEVGPGESCDDGAMNGMYGRCASDCMGPGAFCGDGALNGPEECDDGNAIDSDECLTSCVAARCGDGVVRAGVEECDDGNEADRDGCDAACMREDSSAVDAGSGHPLDASVDADASPAPDASTPGDAGVVLDAFSVSDGGRAPGDEGGGGCGCSAQGGTTDGAWFGLILLMLGRPRRRRV